MLDPVFRRPESAAFGILLFALAIFSMLPVRGAAEPAPPTQNIQATADQLEYLHNKEILHATGNVRIQYQDIIVLADELELNTVTRDLTAKGNVEVHQGKNVWKGGETRGNLNTGIFDFGTYTAASPPWYLKGEGVSRDADGVVHIQHASITTCGDTPESFHNWHMAAKRVVYRPDGSFTAYNVVYKLFDIPLFYFPVAWGQSDTSYGGFEIIPGYKSDWGPYLMIGKEWKLAKGVTNKTTFGYRFSRGPSLKNRTKIKTARSTTDLLLWGLSDDDPPSDLTVGGTDYNGRFESEDQRFRLRLRHHSDWGKYLSLQINTDYRSDNDVLREFFRRDDRLNPQPATQINLAYQRERFDLALNYRPRVNDFESVVERLPELRLNMPRQDILGSRVYYAGETSWAQLRMKWREYDTPRNNPTLDPTIIDPDNYSASRFDSLHLFYLPLKLQGLQITPRIGARFTWYSRTSQTPLTDDQLNSNFLADDPRPSVDNPWSVFNYDDQGGAHWRTAYEFGLELSTKFYHTNTKRYSSRWHLNGLRHVVEPYANYTVIPDPNLDREKIYYFDETDRIDDTNFVRFGVKQRWQTRRNKRIYTFARVESYYDLHFSPRQDLRHTGDIGTVAELRPTDTFSTWMKVLIDSGNWKLDVFRIGTTIGDPNRVHGSISYLVRNQFQTREVDSMGSELTRIHSATNFPTAYEEENQLALTLGLPLGDKMQFNGEFYFDFDQGEVARQSYEITRDLNCWMGALRVIKEPGDFAFMLSLWLKAFPSLGFRAGI